MPLLVKFIFTSERLSVQLHPADGDGVPRGKTEMWHILEAAPGATIAMGFKEAVTREQLREATRTGEIEQLLRWVPVSAGETYVIPAHTVHAIGGGIMLCEIQQNSDVTYRLWDYGRPREIHVEQAVPLCDLGVHPGARTAIARGDGRREIGASPYFVTEIVELGDGGRIRPEAKRCQIWIAIEGSGKIGGAPVKAGEAWLLPDSGAQPEIAASGKVRFLRTWAPE
jgi:mannose-6-phosphate isomerase